MSACCRMTHLPVAVQGDSKVHAIRVRDIRRRVLQRAVLQPAGGEQHEHSVRNRCMFSESLPTLSSSIVAVIYNRFPSGVVAHCREITRALCNHQNECHWLTAWQAGNLSGMASALEWQLSEQPHAMQSLLKLPISGTHCGAAVFVQPAIARKPLDGINTGNKTRNIPAKATHRKGGGSRSTPSIVVCGRTWF